MYPSLFRKRNQAKSLIDFQQLSQSNVKVQDFTLDDFTFVERQYHINFKTPGIKKKLFIYSNLIFLIFLIF